MSKIPPPPPPVVRRGRGTFNRTLHATPAGGESGSTLPVPSASAASSASLDQPLIAPLVQPVDPLMFRQRSSGPKEESSVLGSSSDEDDSSAAPAVADTARLQLFRRERRRRHVLVVGDAVKLAHEGITKLYGHKGPKPLRLKDKYIRLLQIALYRHDRQRKEGDELQPSAAKGEDPSTTTEAQVEKTTPSATQVENNNSTSPSAMPPLAVGADDDAIELLGVDAVPTAEVVASEGTDADLLPPSKPQDDSTTTTTTTTTALPPPPAGNLPHLKEEELVGTLENEDDVRVQPLTVGTSGDRATYVQTTRRYINLCEFFRSEFLHLWSLTDIARQRVQIRFEFGTGFVCTRASRRPLDGIYFTQLIDQWNEESLQMHFVRDSPPCISRALDSQTFSAIGSRRYSVVKMTFFSQDRQSRLIARALWNGEREAFELFDVEGVGISFAWTVFSVDAKAAEDMERRNNNKVDTDTHTAAAELKKITAFPFDVSFRAFSRSKQLGDEGAAAIARAVLTVLTNAERNVMKFGNTNASQYDAVDFQRAIELSENNIQSDYRLETVEVEHVEQRKLRNGLMIESTTSLLVEGFNASKAADEPLRLNRCKAFGNSIYWKFEPERQTHEECLELLPLALELVATTIERANVIICSAPRGGAPPEAL